MALMDALASQIGAVISSAAGLTAGRVTSVSPLRVDTLPVDLLSAVSRHHVAVGDVVLVARQSSQAWVVGVCTARPSQGTIQAVGATTATVALSDGTTHSLEWVGATRPALGQRVLISWSLDGGVIIGACSGSIATLGTGGEATSLPTTSTGATTQSIARPAANACTAKGLAWSTYGSRGRSAWQGQYGGSGALTGFWFHDGGLTATGTAVSGTVTLRRSADTGIGRYGPVTARLRLHSAPSRPDSPPPLHEAMDVPGFGMGSTITADLPTDWVQALLDGTRAGIAVASSSASDYAAFDGPGQTADSGLITLIYR